MKRILLLGLTLAFMAPAGAHAAAPCRDKIYNEWYASGKISTNYPVGCYRDALKHIPPDAQVYSNLGADIKAAMQAAIARSNDPGGGGPTAVGHGPTASTSPQGVAGQSRTTTSRDVGPTAIAPLSSSNGGGGGIPAPILILGVVAILLALAGLVGTGVQHARRRGAA